MAKTAYSEKLKDPRWQKKRLEVFQRDEFTCQKCFDDENNLPLAVHHRHYEKGKEPWEYSLDSLVTLCQDCHQEEYENQYSSEADLIKNLRLAGFFNTDLDLLSLVFYDEAAGKGVSFVHVKEVVLEMIGWMMRSGELQWDMADRYLREFTRSYEIKNGAKEE
jgi:hypothetical protein